jgi:hypothetical protein
MFGKNETGERRREIEREKMKTFAKQFSQQRFFFFHSVLERNKTKAKENMCQRWSIKNSEKWKRNEWK